MGHRQRHEEVMLDSVEVSRSPRSFTYLERGIVSFGSSLVHKPLNFFGRHPGRISAPTPIVSAVVFEGYKSYRRFWRRGYVAKEASSRWTFSRLAVPMASSRGSARRVLRQGPRAYKGRASWDSKDVLLGHPQRGRGSSRASTSTNPALLTSLSIWSGARGSLYGCRPSMYFRDHRRRAFSANSGQVVSNACRPQPRKKTPTVRQRPVVRLSVKIYLHQLAPPSRPQHAMHVPHIVPPTVGVDATGDHLAVHEIEVVRRKREAGYHQETHSKSWELPYVGVGASLTGCSSRPPGSRGSLAVLRAPCGWRCRSR